MMVVYGFQVEIPKGLLSIRAQRSIAMKVHSIVGDYWHEKILPRHFEAGAATKYAHAPRSEEYLERKQRSGHGDVDLVYTGKLRRQLESYALIQGYPSRFSVTMLGPAYISMRPKIRTKGKQPPFKAGEITTVPLDEVKELADLAAAELAKRLMEYPGVTVLRAA